jgi:hypothetical protein
VNKRLLPIVVLFVLFVGCSKKPPAAKTSLGEPERNHVAEETTSATAAAKKPTKARDFASGVHVTLDQTRPEDLVSQIPFQAEMKRGGGEDRVFTWRFDDGSAMVAFFRPAPGYKNGLVLHRIGFE